MSRLNSSGDNWILMWFTQVVSFDTNFVSLESHDTADILYWLKFMVQVTDFAHYNQTQTRIRPYTKSIYFGQISILFLITSGDIRILICRSSCGLGTKYMTYCCHQASLTGICVHLSKILGRFVRPVKSDDGLQWEIWCKDKPK